MEPILLAETDSIRNCFSCLKKLIETLPHSPRHYAIEASGFIGLNYLLIFSPEELVFFHHTQAAIDYIKLILELISVCGSETEFISRIFSRPIEAFLKKGNTLPSFSKLKLQDEIFKEPNQALESSLNEFTQWNYLAMPYDEFYFKETLSLLSEEGKKAFQMLLFPYQKGEVLFEDVLCQRLLPCWPLNQHVPFSMGQMGKNAFGEYEPNTNTFYYGFLWLANKEAFCLIKQKISQAKLSCVLTDSFEQFSGHAPIALYLKDNHSRNNTHWSQYLKRLRSQASFSNFICFLTPDKDPEFFTT